MTFSQEDPRPRTTVRLPKDLKSRLEDASDRTDESQNAIIRDALRYYLDDDDPTATEPPEEDDLAEAWHLLRKMSSDGGWVPAHAAKAELKKMMSLPEPAVNRYILGRLRERGYVREQGEYASGYTAYRVIQ